MNSLKTRNVLLLACLLASSASFAQGQNQNQGGTPDNTPTDSNGKGNGADDIYLNAYGSGKEAEANTPETELTETEIENAENPEVAPPPPPYTNNPLPPPPPVPNVTGNSLVDAWVVPNSGILVDANSIQYVGGNGQSRTYTASTLGTVIDTNGILLTTGNANAPTSNTSSGYSGINNTGGSVDVSAISKQWTYDKNLLEFNFQVEAGVDAVTTKFVFASEEYPEWTGIFKDGFALVVDGVNVAKFDADNFVSMQNCTSNGAFPCTDTTQNTNGFFTPNSGATAQPMEYDGYTAVLFATGLLDLSRTTHTIRAVIADSRDSVWDSAVFLSQLRGLTGTQPPAPAPVPLPAPIVLLGSALAAVVARRRPVVKA